MCVFSFGSDGCPAPTAIVDVRKVEAMCQSGRLGEGTLFNLFKAQHAFAQKVCGPERPHPEGWEPESKKKIRVCGQGLSDNAQHQILVATAVKIPLRAKMLIEDWKTFSENNPVYGTAIQTFEEGSFGSGYVSADSEIR